MLDLSKRINKINPEQHVTRTRDATLAGADSKGPPRSLHRQATRVHRWTRVSLPPDPARPLQILLTLSSLTLSLLFNLKKNSKRKKENKK